MKYSKFTRKYKTDIIALSFIIGFIIIVVTLIIVMNVTRRKKIEDFNNFKLRNINNRITKYIKSFSRPSVTLPSIIPYDNVLNKNVYLIEQVKNNYNKMDDYTIKSNIGSILYNTEGFWDLNDLNFN